MAILARAVLIGSKSGARSQALLDGSLVGLRLPEAAGGGGVEIAVSFGPSPSN